MSTPPQLLDDAALEFSSVVAHRFMNRERELRGGNGYAREIGFDAFDFLAERAAARGRAGWLDLCCGSGRALIDAAQLAMERGIGERIAIRGVDLVDHFARVPRELASPELVTASLHGYATAERYDLITCVHGLHYIGDKLGLLARACGWLTEDGVLVATLDLGTLRLAHRSDAKRPIARALRSCGLEVDTRRHRVRCTGARTITHPWTYLGADDGAGPSFTGEPAVTSCYG